MDNRRPTGNNRSKNNVSESGQNLQVVGSNKPYILKGHQIKERFIL